jgi:hypothetical protein
MIILGGFPSGIVFGPHGITPAQIVSGGNAASPLLNDVDLGDTTTELLWRLEPPYLAVGVTTATDPGAYAVTGLPDGTHLQPYRLFSLPATGAPTSSTSTITTTVGSAAVAPNITVQPQPQAVNVGDSAAFAVTATGTAPLAYQWRRNGVNISGAVAASYVLTSAQPADSGAVFSVVVSNAAGSVFSSAALLTVQSASSPPAIAQDPLTQTVQEAATVSLSVTATGTAPLSYQWRRNGANISGANASIYAFSAALVDSGAAYTVVVSNAFGSVQSAAALLTVLASTAAPAIGVQPISQALQEGDTATFAVTAAGALPITYQWRKNGVAIPGATSSALQVPNITLLDSRSTYQVVVSNAYGQAISSRAELLVPVVSMSAARVGARIDDNRFDADLPRWIDAAIRLAEQFCNRYFTPKTPTFERTAWPAAGETFPISQATDCSITYWDGAAWAALPTGAAVIFADGSRTGVAPAPGSSWPTLGEVAGGPRVRFAFAAGPTSAAGLPVEVEHFVIAHVSLWADENRAAAPQAAQNFPWLYAGLEPLKVY